MGTNMCRGTSRLVILEVCLVLSQEACGKPSQNKCKREVIVPKLPRFPLQYIYLLIVLVNVPLVRRSSISSGTLERVLVDERSSMCGENNTNGIIVSACCWLLYLKGLGVHALRETPRRLKKKISIFSHIKIRGIFPHFPQ